MRVFCLELVSTGFFGEQIATSFRREGEAMLRAALDDLESIAGVSASTIVDIGQRESWSQAAQTKITFWQPEGCLESVAADLAAEADATLIVAPEMDGLLERFCQLVRLPRSLSLNCGPDALALCSDKFRLAEHFAAHQIATIPTRCCSIAEVECVFPCVVKPRDGAGSWLVWLIRSRADWALAAEEYREAGLHEVLVQPWIAGRACSMAALRTGSGNVELLLVAEQVLSANGRFQYQGGRIPAGIDSALEEQIPTLVERALSTIPGWSGYVGLDLLLPDDCSTEPLIVEINPRLTTSYLGYRQLCRENLMERWLFPERFSSPLAWREEVVSFVA